MKERTYCVYRIYNKVEKKSYIGSTCHFETRIKEHKRGKHEWQIDFNQHPENWEIYILEDNISDKEVQYKEVYYIDSYNAIDNGYNKNRLGNTSTLEVREKLSKSISKASIGKKISEETKKKISDTLIGKFTGENHPMYGKHHNEETKKKISEHRKGKTVGENNPFYGKHHNEETRQKMRDAKIGYVPINKGKIFVYNDTGNKCINPKELQKYLDLEYKKGFKPKE